MKGNEMNASSRTKGFPRLTTAFALVLLSFVILMGGLAAAATLKIDAMVPASFIGFAATMLAATAVWSCAKGYSAWRGVGLGVLGLLFGLIVTSPLVAAGVLKGLGH